MWADGAKLGFCPGCANMEFGDFGSLGEMTPFVKGSGREESFVREAGYSALTSQQTMVPRFTPNCGLGMGCDIGLGLGMENMMLQMMAQQLVEDISQDKPKRQTICVKQNGVWHCKSKKNKKKKGKAKKKDSSSKSKSK